jgi:aryl-alcohol dehydrogenase-like predicted oxidoreductase
MNYRKLGRTNWKVSEIGYGMWGLAGWTGSDIKETEEALDLAVESGCNFFDTAWAYAAGKSESILGDLLKRHPSQKLYVATKIPPKNLQWPAKKEFKLEDVYPIDHIVEYTEKSLKNLKVDCIDLQQFHVWTDEWTKDEKWMRAVEKLKAEGKIKAMGISINRWEPENAIEALQTNLIDVVQVIYNIFDQNPEDRLFPLCEQMNIGVIARVPFDEGTLTGTLTKDTKFPDDDFRSTYFCEENLIPSVERAERLRSLIPEGMTMAEMALRFILANKNVGTTIPGMRKIRNVKANMATGDGKALPENLLQELKKHRWDRVPTEWSH